MNEPVVILVVQRDEADAAAVRELISRRSLPWNLTTVRTLAEARARLDTKAHLDLIIADFDLPDGSAADLFAPDQPAPVIVLTSTMEPPPQLCSLDRGADDCLPRRIFLQHPEMLLVSVQKALHRLHTHQREQQLKRDLSESEQRLNLALESGRAGMVQWDLHNNRAWWNAYSYLIHGYEPFSFEPTYAFWRSRIHPDDIGAVEADIALCLTRQKREMTAQYRIIRPNGEIRWVLGIGRFQFDAEGFASCFTGIALDVTERKQMEDELTAIAQLPAENPAPIIRLSTTGQLLYTNRAAELLVKTTPAVLNTLQSASVTALTTGQTHELELTCNDQRVYSFTCVPIPARNYANCYGRDVTDLHRAKAAAEQANSAKDQFLAVLSHELRTPLTAVLPALEELSELIPQAAREDLEMARRNVELEARLIDDLLDITRISRGKLELQREAIDLSTILRRAAEVCMPDIQARRLHFGITTGNGPCPIIADPARLQQVFWNLIKNAVKFTPPGGCVGIRCFADDTGHVLTEVNDSGVGIEPANLPRIFNAFEQAGRAVTRQFGGLGLGLAISKTLVEMHGGAISVRSPGKGHGATFIVTLPLFTRPTPPTPAAPSILADAEPEVPPRRILLVEDHGDTSRILTRMLQSKGHTVEPAGDVATALELAAARPFDLLISDLGLPDRSGLELMQELRRSGHHLPAIALSGYGQEEDIRRSHEVGFREHLTKPVNIRQLQSAIARVTAPTADP